MQEGYNPYAYNCEDLKYYVHTPDLRDDIVVLGWNPRTISQHNVTYSRGLGGSVDVLNKQEIGDGFLTGAGDASLHHNVQEGPTSLLSSRYWGLFRQGQWGRRHGDTPLHPHIHR
jgi:hypothetical protein